jgi:glycopeptide antibiotics resistance protein
MELPNTSGDQPGLSSPRRTHLFLLALAFTAIALYGSFVPFKYRPLDWDVAVERFRNIRYFDLGIRSRADWVANILLFIPISYLWIGVALVDRRRALLWGLFVVPVVVVSCTALCVGIEFTQLWFPPRTVSQNDIQAETIGSMIGAALWMVTGQLTVNWMRTFTVATRPRQRIDWYLQLYLLGLIIYSILPLDLTIHPQEIYQKIAKGKLELIPLTNQSPMSLKTWWNVITNMLVFVPVGAWAATVWTRQRERSRSLIAATAIGIGMVVGIEAAQLFIFSRFTSATDVVSGTIGVIAGAWLLRLWSGQKSGELSASESAGGALSQRSNALRLLLCVSILAYSAALCAFFWWPMDLLRKGKEVKERLKHFWSIPFSSLYKGSEFNAASEIVRKTMLFAVLGVMWIALVHAFGFRRAARYAGITIGLLYCVALATGIEVAQAAFPPRVSDVTDVILYTSGSILGMIVMTRILGTGATAKTGRD